MNVNVTVENLLSGIRGFFTRQIDEKKLYALLEGYLQNDLLYNKENEELITNEIRIIANQEERLYYFFMSYLLYVTMSTEVFNEMVKHCIDEKVLDKEEKFFLYNQFKSIFFLKGNIIDGVGNELLDQLYNQIFEAFKLELGKQYTFIPKEERNSDFVVVIGTQIIGMGHGPTKTLFDRSYVLSEDLKKNVFILNTAELLTKYKPIAFFGKKTANYIDQYLGLETIAYEEKHFAFMQCPKEMPQVSIIKEIMAVVQSEKPYFILTIGESLVGDLLSQIVPVIELATVFSGRVQTRAQFQVIGREVNDADRKWLERNNLPKDQIVESVFTFSLIKQENHFTRKELGLPENRFIILVVGARLDDEIDNECIELICRLAEKGLFIAFMGIFDKYNEYVKENALLQENTKFLGFQKDVLAINECCDIYLNPKRVGGGTSCAEALYKGIPVVTCDYGDVAVVAGSDFFVSDYEEMYQKIVLYSENKDYYNLMSEKALLRGKRVTDSKKEFIKVIQEIEKNERF